MKAKDGKEPRLNFHVIMPIEPVRNDKTYSLMKEKMTTLFPQFDSNDLDSGRFLFGTENPQGEVIPDEGHLEDVIRDVAPSYWWKEGEATQKTLMALSVSRMIFRKVSGTTPCLNMPSKYLPDYQKHQRLISHS